MKAITSIASKKVKLESICKIVRGSSPRPKGDSRYFGGPIPRLMVEDLTRDGRLVTPKIDSLTSEGAKLSRPVPAGTIVMVVSGDVGRVARLSIDACIHDGFVGLLDLDVNQVSPEYLVFCLDALKSIHASNTAGAIWQNLTTDQIKEFNIPLPSLPEQQRIAAILAKADRIRRLRRYALDLGESYLQSVFLEMFGAPVSNPKGWERAQIFDLGKVTTGNTPPREHSEYYGDYIEWIKSDNILADEMFVTKSAEMLSKEGMRQGRCVNAGSVLVTCIAGSLTSIGNAALTNRNVAFNQQINAITPFKDVNSLFLYTLIKVAKPIIQEAATDGMKHLLSKSNFESVTLFKPPLSLQTQFAQIARKCERLRAQQREAVRQAEHLFQTLLHRAFTGLL